MWNFAKVVATALAGGSWWLRLAMCDSFYEYLSSSEPKARRKFIAPVLGPCWVGWDLYAAIEPSGVVVVQRLIGPVFIGPLLFHLVLGPLPLWGNMP